MGGFKTDFSAPGTRAKKATKTKGLSKTKNQNARVRVKGSL
jgi:hypothetical protein